MSEPVFDDEHEVFSSDAPPLFTMVPEWITYSDLKPAQREFWTVLASCVNHSEAHNRVWPAGPELADAMRISNPDQLKSYREALQSIGAVRITERRYANGMRRRYVYDVRFHPPKDYTGPRTRHEWLARRRSLLGASAAAESADTAAFEAANPDATAVHPGPPKNRGAGTPENRGAGPPKNRGAKPDQQQPDQQQPQQAPAARSAGDGRSPSTGSSAREDRCGLAASNTTAPQPTRTPRSHQGQLSQEQAGALRAVEARYPAELAAQMPAHRPPAIRNAIQAALGEAARQRTCQQLADRLERRWYNWGFADKHRRGEIASYPGVVVSLLTRHICAYDRCEDGWDIDTGEPCRTCPERQQLRHERRKAHPHNRLWERERVGPAYWECTVPECRQPGKGTPPPDGLCPTCRAQAEQAAAAAQRVAQHLVREDASGPRQV
ncbi:hypothetical protein [Streptomyces sp. NPDC048248]|uniref:hypothetical protein n=1 Tax=Streptomyces sp. NPDC048248 TaxID=3365523 RepID=UPI00371478CF